METDEILEAKESEVREIRDHCKDKIEKHKSEASRLREDREHREVQIAQLISANLELKFQVDEFARRGRVLSSNLVASFLIEDLCWRSQTVCPSTVVKLCLSFLGCRRAVKY